MIFIAERDLCRLYSCFEALERYSTESYSCKVEIFNTKGLVRQILKDIFFQKNIYISLLNHMNMLLNESSRLTTEGLNFYKIILENLLAKTFQKNNSFHMSPKKKSKHFSTSKSINESLNTKLPYS